MRKSRVSWHSKKQTVVSLSTNEYKYLALGSCGTQLIWIMHQLLDHNLSYEGVPIFFVTMLVLSVFLNKSCINLEQEYRCKASFILNHVENGDFFLEFIDSNLYLKKYFAFLPLSINEFLPLLDCYYLLSLALSSLLSQWGRRGRMVSSLFGMKRSSGREIYSSKTRGFTMNQHIWEV